jgi:tripartite-type tricarboxylate transporter receptor subunit TctC
VSFFTMELFKLAYGLDLAHVPFAGTGPVKNAIMGGHVNIATSGFGSLTPLIKSGDIVPLVTTSPKRLPAFPNVPTMAEKGFPDASLNIWLGLYVPARTPKPIVDKVAADINEVVAAPDVSEKLIAQGAVPKASTPAELQALIDADRARYGRIIREKGLKAE